MSQLLDQIPQIMMMLLISFLTGFTVNLNKYANDKINNNVKPTVFYLSESLLSLICGIITGLTGKCSFPNSPELWIVFSAVGAYGYKKIFNVICKIILSKINVKLDDEKKGNEDSDNLKE